MTHYVLGNPPLAALYWGVIVSTCFSFIAAAVQSTQMTSQRAGLESPVTAGANKRGGRLSTAFSFMRRNPATRSFASRGEVSPKSTGLRKT
jgi:hypothetical protein